MRRTYWHSRIIAGGPYDGNEVRKLVPEWEANLVGSLLDEHDEPDPEGIVETWHAPALDLDVPARLIPSSTPGHSHLYVDVRCEWAAYVNLLHALERCGIIETGYLDASLARGMSMLRKPGVRKEVAA